jgi:hypothetical protein
VELTADLRLCCNPEPDPEAVAGALTDGVAVLADVERVRSGPRE